MGLELLSGGYRWDWNCCLRISTVVRGYRCSEQQSTVDLPMYYDIQAIGTVGGTYTCICLELLSFN